MANPRCTQTYPLWGKGPITNDQNTQNKWTLLGTQD